ncbi:OmpA family protein [Pseudomonadota bacterium]
MSYRLVKLATLLFAVVFIGMGCSGKALKQENADLKQQSSQDQQTIQDYADKLRAAEQLSEQESVRYDAEMETLRRDLDTALKENQVLVKKLEDLTIIEIEHSVLFGSGQADLSSEGKSVVKEIAAVFNNYTGYHMRVEGHTDNLPMNAELKQHYFSNWELSAARAANVVRYMIYALDVPSKNLSIAGYADNRPIATNDDKAGRAQNRRIRAVVFRNLAPVNTN